LRWKHTTMGRCLSESCFVHSWRSMTLYVRTDTYPPAMDITRPCHSAEASPKGTPNGSEKRNVGGGRGRALHTFPWQLLQMRLCSLPSRSGFVNLHEQSASANSQRNAMGRWRLGICDPESHPPPSWRLVSRACNPGAHRFRQSMSE
jgi:hypothetical protein